MTDVYFWVAITACAVIIGLSKSGIAYSIATLGVPVLATVMSARDAAGVMLPVMLVMDAVALVVYARHFNRQILKVMLPGSIVGIGVGWVFSSIISEPAVLLAIGIVTFLFVLDAWFSIRKKLAEVAKPSATWGSFWGAISGFTSFISHTGGPPYQVYTLPFGLSPTVLVGTSTIFFAIVNAVKLIPYYFLGQLDVANLQLSLVMLPIAIGALLVGFFVVRSVPQKVFYDITYALLFVFSLKFIWDGGTGVLASG